MLKNQGYDFTRFNIIDNVTLPTIERISYGIKIECEHPEQAVDSLQVSFVPVERTVFEWQGTEYKQLSSPVLQPMDIQDTKPLTETTNIGINDVTVQFVYEWTAGCDGLRKTLTASRLSKDNLVILRQSFTILVTGDPAEGLFVRDVNGDGTIEITKCEHTFPSSIKLKEEPWPSMQPICTTYHWDTAKQQFTPRH